MNRPNDRLVPIQVTPRIVLDIYEKLQRYDRLFPEDSGCFNSVEDFVRKLTDGKTVGFETSEGVILLNDIIPSLSGSLHLTFYDGILSERLELVKDCISWFFLELDLRRIEVLVPEYAKAYRRFVEKKLHFAYEGCKRQAVRYRESACNLLIFSCLREEGV